ncbi:hypothetical protein D0Y65_041782 [Glycine soja]|uniref:Retrovirus-related Pol polyprotein from transposon TNT 1-94 n=1 Tax=Glycine soja TaxID=3848 RepID=A0A445GX70_GLYSO|nr:hypothetical protein D0Y65_041782 [Glycine soja]
MLIGDNFANCKEQILLTLGCMELDLTLRVDEPPIPMEGNDQVKTYMKAIEEQFVRSDKSMSSTIMIKLSSMRFDNSKGVQEHLMEMRAITAKLRPLEVEISKFFLVHLILNSLPPEYGIVEEVEKDQHGTFAKFLVEEGIDAQYTMASTPQQNGYRGIPKKKDQYLCFAENFCACYSFFNDVLNRVQTSFEAQNFVFLPSLSLHSSSPTFKLLSMAYYVLQPLGQLRKFISKGTESYK